MMGVTGPTGSAVESTSLEGSEGGTAMAGKFELYTDAGGKYRFRLKAGNGEIIAVSEAYNSKASAENGIASVRTNAPTAEVVEL